MKHPHRLSSCAALLTSLLTFGLVASASAVSDSQVFLGNGAEHGDAHLAAMPPPSPRELRGKFLHITDFHPDEYYRSSTSEQKSCHRGKGDAGVYGTEVSDCDSSFSLVNATFDWIAANLKDEIDFVIWTGDSARHDNDESIPRNAAEVLRTNQRLVDQMKEVFADDKNPKQLVVPVIPNIGNNDFLPHNVLLPGPNRWLRYYADMWRPFIPEDQHHVFEFGGWYSVEVIPNQLSVFSLNTMYFFDRNAGIDDCTTPSEPGFKQMEWLRIQLQQLRERGMKAILLGHVPPVKTASKQLWDDTCWQKYNLWMRQYRDVVVGSVYGHMNIDHFFLQDTKDINIRALGGSEGDYDPEDYEEDEGDIDSDDYEQGQDTEPLVKASGKSKYLRELRKSWAKLPEVKPLCKDSQETSASSKLSGGKKKGRKRGKKDAEKKLGGKWAERYHLSFVGASIVPTFFPSMRVVEYNITGLQDAQTWGPLEVPNSATILDIDEMIELESEVRQAKALKKSKKGKKGEHKDPNLVVPYPPDKSSQPGPAYAPQPLTWMGYTQYFANISRLNEQAASGENHGEEFQYEVEYDTFSDPMYKLEDMTVRNYVKLAYRMGLAKKKKKGRGKSSAESVDDFEDVDELEGDGDEHEGEGDETAGEADHIECQVLDAGKNRKRKRKSDKAWRHFLRYAFVSTGFEVTSMEEFDEGQEDGGQWDEL